MKINLMKLPINLVLKVLLSIGLLNGGDGYSQTQTSPIPISKVTTTNSELVIPKETLSIQGLGMVENQNLEKITVDLENPKYSSVDGVLFNKDKTTLIYCPPRLPILNETHVYTIPSGVKSIDKNAFSCPELAEVVIPSSVTSIGEHAFDGCKILQRPIFLGDAPNFGKSVFSKTIENFKIQYYGGKGFNIVTWSNNYGESWPTENLGKLLKKGDSPIGIWSNKAEGFYTVSLGFRTDGKGTFSGGVMTLPTKWKKDGEKIIINGVPLPGMGIAGSTPTNALELTIGDFNTVTIGIPSPQTGAKEQKLYLVSEDEPPDLVAVVEKQQKEQREKILAQIAKRDEALTKETNQVSSAEELSSIIDKFCTTHTSTAFPSPSLSVQGTKEIDITTIGTVAIVTTLLDRSLPENHELLKYCQYSWSNTEPKSNYPKQVVVDNPSRNKLLEFTKAKKLTYENTYLFSPIEAGNSTYSTIASITIKENPQLVASLIKFMVQDVLRDKGPFTVIQKYPR